MILVVSEITFTELVPLDADCYERAALEDDLAAFVANLKESGMNPTVDVEATSGGDVFIVTADGEAFPCST